MNLLLIEKELRDVMEFEGMKATIGLYVWKEGGGIWVDHGKI